MKAPSPCSLSLRVPLSLNSKPDNEGVPFVWKHCHLPVPSHLYRCSGRAVATEDGHTFATDPLPHAGAQECGSGPDPALREPTRNAPCPCLDALAKGAPGKRSRLKTPHLRPSMLMPPVLGLILQKSPCTQTPAGKQRGSVTPRRRGSAWTDAHGRHDSNRRFIKQVRNGAGARGKSGLAHPRPQEHSI